MLDDPTTIEMLIEPGDQRKHEAEAGGGARSAHPPEAGAAEGSGAGRP